MQVYQQAKSKFHIYREKYQPKHPKILSQKTLQAQYQEAKILPKIAKIFPHIVQKGVKSITFRKGQQTQTIITPLRIGCVLSGGQAAGGHNVIVGIYQYIKKRHPNSQLFGFLNGPCGIYTGKYIELNQSHMSYFKNRGGFDMICSGRDKIQTIQQKQKSLKYCQSLKLDGLVIIGGDDSNTNAAILAQYFLSMKSSIKVVGCPKTIDGDLKNQFVQVSFGFDTACKTYSECIGSVMTDTLSSKKYYHFIRLMGRSASHIALQCSLLTHPTYTFIGQQVQHKNLTLKHLVNQLAEIIIKRAQNNKFYGVVLIPQGLIQFIPQMGILISKINKIMGKIKQSNPQQLRNLILSNLDQQSKQLFQFLPNDIALQLLLDRDPHGNVQVAKIQTQKFIIDLLKKYLKQIQFQGKFQALANYFGYQGRCAFPTPFDCDYCYSLGLNAGAIIEAGETGMMSCVRNLDKEPENWLPGGYPLVTMMDIENRKGEDVPVITKALVDLNGTLFKFYESKRQQWALEDHFNIVGPVQYQFPNPKPYLAITPTNFFWSQQIKNYKTPPFAQISKLHLNELTYNLAMQQPQIPSILNQQISLIYSQKLEYNNIELYNIVKHQYPFLFNHDDKMITFKRIYSKNIQRKKTRIGICFNGRQFPGGHNIIKGLFGQNVQLLGFIGGNKGLFNKKYIQIDENILEYYQNQSGYHLLGRSSDSIRTQKQLELTKIACQHLDLDGLVLVGASHTLTDSTIVANYLLKESVKTCVIGIPASIDDSVHHQNLQVSIGFSTSSHMYSTLISNLMIDASSNTKYWYFIRLMGRDPSHLTLECALSTHPNYAIISQEVEHKGWDLQDLVQDIVRVIKKRQQKGLSFGCILIPQGLPHFLPFIQRLKTQMDQIGGSEEHQLLQKMSNWTKQKYLKLPDFIKKQLNCRDNKTRQLAYSQIETQKLLAYMVGQRIKQLKSQGKFKGSYSSVCHFFGYQGRCAIPNLLDRNLSMAYGRISRILIQNKVTGYCPSIRGVTSSPSKWFPIGIPLSHMLDIKEKSSYGINKPIVKSYNVDLNSTSFIQFSKKRVDWELFDHYQSPGPIQHFGQMKNYVPLTLLLQRNFDSKMMEEIEQHLHDLKSRCKFGSNVKELKIIRSNLASLMETLKIIERN